MEYQPTKNEIPSYAQHEAGWCYYEEGSGDPLAELDFVGFRRPYFVFKVKLLTNDNFVKDTIYNPLAVYSEMRERKFFLRNRSSEDIIQFGDFLTDRIGDDIVTLRDWRPGRSLASHGNIKNALFVAIINVLDVLSFGPLVRSARHWLAKKGNNRHQQRKSHPLDHKESSKL